MSVDEAWVYGFSVCFTFTHTEGKEKERREAPAKKRSWRKEAKPPERSRMAGPWEHEVGRLLPKLFSNSMASQEFVRSLGL
ncbi:hypothetical protein GUJ93_ZPchr0009g2432 [Zizania palustris]|uniref:Uncharacterized protein n=1 Tax=Zizania palustris TaxID=103762 RepID=A0A8J5VNF6_ZIZPA|nr:hypothetical protein GUJ93_ZPchr0009g2432 [Zizania palustris]